MPNLLPDRDELNELADQYSTPLLIVSPRAVAENVRGIETALGGSAALRFALKSASSPGVLLGLPRDRLVIDVASALESEMSDSLGFPASRQHFYSPGASGSLLQRLGTMGVGITVDSETQAEALLSIGGRMNGEVLLRVVPTVSVDSHFAAVVSTGPTKLGMPAATAVRCARRLLAADVPVCGVHAHLGSLLCGPQYHIALAEELADLLTQIPGGSVVNVGGGMAVRYVAEGADFDFGYLASGLRAIAEVRGRPGQVAPQFVIEPGRAIAATGAAMLTRVLDVKRTDDGIDHLVVDARLNSLGLSLPVDNCTCPAIPSETVRAFGTACTPGDRITSSPCPAARIGDLLCIRMAGAYVVTLEGSLQMRAKATEVIWHEPCNHELFRAAPGVEQFRSWAI